MRNEILLIPDKPDIERDSIAKIWIDKGGEVLRISKFWERPSTSCKRITIYGNDTFSLVLAKVLDLDLMLARDELIGEIDKKWTKRQIDILQITQVRDALFPTFIKPVNPKTFKSKVYISFSEFHTETKGIEPNDKVIRSEIIAIDSEVRAFILNKKILDSALYEGSADLNAANQFLMDFLSNNSVALPKSFVVDLGYNDKLGWFILEFNSSWGAGLNSCRPNKVIRGIREATVN